MPKLVIGLGNPGNRYRTTRHNAGCWLLDAVAEQTGLAFSSKQKFNAAVAIGGGQPTLVKPQTFMNDSGTAVVAVAAFFRIAAADILIVHDEVDVPAGDVKLKFGGGTAGHRGLADISQRLGDNAYWRLRLGIGKPAIGGVADYVLQSPTADEQVRIDDAITRVLAVWKNIAADDYNYAMSILHNDNCHGA